MLQGGLVRAAKAAAPLRMSLIHKTGLNRAPSLRRSTPAALYAPQCLPHLLQLLPTLRGPKAACSHRGQGGGGLSCRWWGRVRSCPSTAFCVPIDAGAFNLLHTGHQARRTRGARTPCSPRRKTSKRCSRALALVSYACWHVCVCVCVCVSE
jgi:hypothetical protein